LKKQIYSWLEQHRQLFVPILLVLVLLGISGLRGPRLFTSEGIAGAIIVVTPLILAALAVTPIVLVGRGGVDLSVGPLLGFINVTLVKWLVETNHASPPMVVAYIVCAGVLYQSLIAAIVVYVRVAPIIVTLAGFLVLTGVNLVILDRPSGVAPEWMQGWGYGTDVVSPVFLILIAMIVLWSVFSRTAFYQQIMLTGANERMAFASGVNTIAARFGAHIVAGIFTAVAALTYTALIGSGDPTQGNSYTLFAISALVLGGTSLAGGSGGGLGSILGAISIYLISYVLSTYNFGGVSGFVTQLSTGVILVVALLINGLMSRRVKKS
jgi:ribose transport system permease protein